MSIITQGSQYLTRNNQSHLNIGRTNTAGANAALTYLRRNARLVDTSLRQRWRTSTTAYFTYFDEFWKATLRRQYGYRLRIYIHGNFFLAAIGMGAHSTVPNAIRHRVSSFNDV